MKEIPKHIQERKKDIDMDFYMDLYKVGELNSVMINDFTYLPVSLLHKFPFIFNKRNKNINIDKEYHIYSREKNKFNIKSKLGVLRDQDFNIFVGILKAVFSRYNYEGLEDINSVENEYEFFRTEVSLKDLVVLSGLNVSDIRPIKRALKKLSKTEVDGVNLLNYKISKEKVVIELCKEYIEDFWKKRFLIINSNYLDMIDKGVTKALTIYLYWSWYRCKRVFENRESYVTRKFDYVDICQFLGLQPQKYASYIERTLLGMLREIEPFKFWTRFMVEGDCKEGFKISMDIDDEKFYLFKVNANRDAVDEYICDVYESMENYKRDKKIFKKIMYGFPRLNTEKATKRMKRSYLYYWNKYQDANEIKGVYDYEADLPELDKYGLMMCKRPSVHDYSLPSYILEQLAELKEGYKFTGKEVWAGYEGMEFIKSISGPPKWSIDSIKKKCESNVCGD